MNLSSKINKLQQALRLQGKLVLITRRQVYLKDADAVATKYSVTEPEETILKNGLVKTKYVELLSTFSQVELVKYLADLYKEVQSG